MDATGYFGATNKNSNNFGRDQNQNQSLHTIETYNDDELFDSRPASGMNKKS